MILSGYPLIYYSIKRLRYEITVTGKHDVGEGYTY